MSAAPIRTDWKKNKHNDIKKTDRLACFFYVINYLN